MELLSAVFQARYRGHPKKGKWISKWSSQVPAIGAQRVCRRLWGADHFSNFSCGGPQSPLLAPGPLPGLHTVVGCVEEARGDAGLQHPVPTSSSQSLTQVGELTVQPVAARAVFYHDIKEQVMRQNQL